MPASCCRCRRRCRARRHRSGSAGWRHGCCAAAAGACAARCRTCRRRCSSPRRTRPTGTASGCISPRPRWASTSASSARTCCSGSRCWARSCAATAASRRIRTAGGNVLHQLTALLRDSERCWVGIAPEGTRTQVTRWRIGFWKIAEAAGVPIIPVYLHYPDKVIGVMPAFYQQYVIFLLAWLGTVLLALFCSPIVPLWQSLEPRIRLKRIRPRQVSVTSFFSKYSRPRPESCPGRCAQGRSRRMILWVVPIPAEGSSFGMPNKQLSLMKDFLFRNAGLFFPLGRIVTAQPPTA